MHDLVLTSRYLTRRYFRLFPSVPFSATRSTSKLFLPPPWFSLSSARPIMTTATQQPDDLPPLSKKDLEVYNHMAEHMDYFHDHFRQQWTILYKAASGTRPQGMSVRQLIQAGQQFCRQLTLHHTIEETRIFPVLATKMPAFREELDLLEHHKKIHEGIEKMEVLFEEIKTGARDYSAFELKRVMDSFGSILFEHLDAEVSELAGPNMRRFWTIDEMRRMPM